MTLHILIFDIICLISDKLNIQDKLNFIQINKHINDTNKINDFSKLPNKINLTQNILYKYENIEKLKLLPSYHIKNINFLTNLKILYAEYKCMIGDNDIKDLNLKELYINLI